MVKNRFYIENPKFNLIILGNKTDKLACSFPSKAPREVSPLIVFLLDMLLRTHKNFFDVHQKKSSISPNGRVAVFFTHPVACNKNSGLPKLAPL